MLSVLIYVGLAEYWSSAGSHRFSCFRDSLKCFLRYVRIYRDAKMKLDAGASVMGLLVYFEFSFPT